MEWLTLLYMGITLIMTFYWWKSVNDPVQMVMARVIVTGAMGLLLLLYNYWPSRFVVLLRYTILMLALIQWYPETYEFELGKGITLHEGSDVAVIATGLVVNEALKAVKELEAEGISARLINIHTIKPIDRELVIKAAQETGRIITVEEHNVIGGLGDAVCEVTSAECPVPVRRIGVYDQFGYSGPAKELLDIFGLTAPNIKKVILEELDKK